MAKKAPSTTLEKHVPVHKKTCIDTKNPKMSSMNKSVKRGFKKYRGQGRP